MVTTFNTIEELPTFTEKGYHLDIIPSKPWDKIYAYYELSKFMPPEDDYDTSLKSKFYNIGRYNGVQLSFLDLLKGPCEAFANQELEYSNMYGIREYLNGATLPAHTDRLATHHISAIIMLDTDTDWPIEIQGHNGEWKSIIMNPGHILFYESAKCLHGRSTPFQGKSFKNCYVHYKLKNYQYGGE